MNAFDPRRSRATPAYAGTSPFPDTSRVGTRAVMKRALTPRVVVPPRQWFPIVKGKHLHAPAGYAFNKRGDLISLKREAQRRAA